MISRSTARAPRIVAIGALTAGLLSGAMAVAPSAAAAYAGQCNSNQVTTAGVTSGYSITRPAYQTDSGRTANCWMDYGSKGSGVSWLQFTLNSCYGFNLATDGDFGPATRDALATAQGRENISADGQYGTQSRQYLKFPRYRNITGDRSGCESIN
ncbi:MULTISPECIES: peptidoglycan-binding domain-containing protein [Streptomyces]|uniref:peptidoglycan-binding domain-containing protein n=1 Tax=Streptomyces TaxID=1883 RepID=UPI0005662D05|nr:MULTISPECIES: peptidoglycan-binding domain-containing protein [Streptomyces]MBZ6128587.1 peptidoglycan-binding protein [Streptomyces olivaceus]MBZ6162939.1 peptidoglycan-binding protein [Streptomyces olivaceus]MBZ6190742.1 peptidoglycan-binding protein [Streptomyces olivaceus]MBZ6225429.1 peptidoglycan-binding protein [Streptomyces olivaceus]MBZ6239147.1 peptidoglycan-binding protein [Streptomyces olivaceus]